MNWYIRKAGVVSGPLPEEDIRHRLERNLLTSMDEASTDGRVWQRIRQTPLWKPAAAPVPPPPPPPKEVPESASRREIHITPAVLHARRVALGKPTPAPSPFAWVEDAERMASEYRINSRQSNVFVSGHPQIHTNGNPSVPPTSPEWKLPTYVEERAKAEQTEVPETHASVASFSFWRLLTGGVFKRHRDPAELASILSGSRVRAVAPGDYPRTWFWSRIALWSLLLTAITLGMAFGNPNMLPGFFLVAAFGVPICVLMFFIECDVTRSISAWKVLGTFLVIGILSLLGTTILNGTEAVQSIYGTFGDAGAGPVEEVAKESLLLLYVGRTKRYPYILNGLLLGAAIGAGFAAFESAGYLFNAWLGAAAQGAEWWEAVAESTVVAFIRSFYAPFCHIAWTAAVGGALWAARGTTGTFSDAFRKVYVWGILLLSIALHFLWNLGLTGTFIGFIAWFPIIHFLRQGFEQQAVPSE